MDKVQEYVMNANQALETKKALLDAMLHKYQTLMEASDDQLRIKNSNPRVLQNDPVYNSTDISSVVKQAFESRQLHGMTPEEFEGLYKSAMYGVPGEEKIVPQVKPELVKTERRVNYDKVPSKIGIKTASRAGHTPEYLLAKAREYNLTRKNLNELIDLKRNYKTDFPTMLALIGDGASTDELDILLQVRADLRDFSYVAGPVKAEESIQGKSQNVSLRQLWDFYQNVYKPFSSHGASADDVSNFITRLHEILEEDFLSTTITKTTRMARENRTELVRILDEI